MCQVSWTVNARRTDEVAAVMAQVAASVGELRAALAVGGVVIADDQAFPDVAASRSLRAAREAAA
ncbi:hypothetical protein ACFY1V_19965 [Streptomyces sp. NPDC001255]|uniref:hypothetical protein n=1 Tax=Streptomyces sp. NPDC001255 TaxID=3364550 RepID=UPI0036BB184F